MAHKADMLPGFKWPVGVTRAIAAPSNGVWNVISSPGLLPLYHPFCSENLVNSWPGPGSSDEVHYFSGWVFERQITHWLDGVGYDLEIGSHLPARAPAPSGLCPLVPSRGLHPAPAVAVSHVGRQGSRLVHYFRRTGATQPVRFAPVVLSRRSGEARKRLVDGGLADVVVLVHLAFIVFVATGGLLVLRWPKVAWAHLPSALWGALIELMGWVCPLTPLENTLRTAGGGSGYEGGFIVRYVMPVVYPSGLTRGMQVALGIVIITVNLFVYGVAARRWSGSRTPRT